jgi:hypothetical protein
LKLANYLHIKTTNVFFTTIFRVGLLPNLKLAIVGMKRKTLIEHKEVAVICEESGLINLSYNALLITPKANIVIKLVVPIVITKSTLICTNCGKTSHLVETCHNKKRNVPVVPTAIVKFTKPVAKTQPIELRKIPIHYHCIICSSIGHRLRECPQKIEVQNMFRTKPISSNATTSPKPPKTNNVLVNVVVIVTI